MTENVVLPDPGIAAVDAERAERGLRDYVRSVARGLRVGREGVWCEVAEEAGAYLALDARLPRQPDRDVALVWDEHRGWAMGVETGSEEDLVIVSWYGPELLPGPAEVARFVRGVLTGDANPSGPPAMRRVQQERLFARLAVLAL